MTDPDRLANAIANHLDPGAEDLEERARLMAELMVEVCGEEQFRPIFAGQVPPDAGLVRSEMWWDGTAWRERRL
jgi:hypothetical protein